MKSIKAYLAGAMALAAVGCGYPGEGEDNAAPVKMSAEQAAKQSALGIKEQAVGACGAWQADPDPQLTVNTSSYSNGVDENTGYACAGWGTYGYKYQCVELAQRYYAVRWGFPAVWANVQYASQMCTYYPSGIQTENLAGGATIWHGDLAVFGWAPYGHVAVITKDNGNGTFNVVEQNTGSGGTNTYYRSQTSCGLWTWSNTGPH
jgi:hypothetical protein